MSTEDLEDYESEVELQLYREYKDVCPMFRYWVETERRQYLANEVQIDVHVDGGRTWFEVELRDAWVLDMFRTNRFLPSIRLLSFKDVVVEELPKDLEDLAGDAEAATIDLAEPGERVREPIDTRTDRLTERPTDGPTDAEGPAAEGSS